MPPQSVDRTPPYNGESHTSARLGLENYGAFFGGPAVHAATFLAGIEQDLTGHPPTRIDEPHEPAFPLDPVGMATTGAHLTAMGELATLATLTAFDLWAECWRQGAVLTGPDRH